MLKLNNISKSFYQGRTSIKIVDDLSLTVNPGEVYGFLGPNGAGKTTTVKMIVNILFPDSGSISINGISTRLTESRECVGFMNESPQFYYHLKAYEVIDYARALFGLGVDNLITDSLLKDVGLISARNVPVRKFSKGMHTRLGFAVALVNNPKLLILDEPLDGLDPLGRQDFKKLINKLKKQGTTVFFSSHILSDAEEICDRIGILNRGKLIVEGKPKVLAKNRSLEEYFVEVINNDKQY